MVLHTIVKEKDYKFEQFVDFLAKTLGVEQMQQVNAHFFELWNIADPTEAQADNDFVENYGKVLSNPFTKLTRGGKSQSRVKKVESVEQTMKKFEMIIDDFTTKQE